MLIYVERRPPIGTTTMVDKLKIGDSSMPRKSAVIATKVNELIDEVDSITPGGGGGGGPVEYLDVANETKQLTKDDQYVRVKSDSANTVITLPPTSTVNDGHFVNFFRDVGTFAQFVKSNDTAVADPPEIDSTPSLLIPLNGSYADISPSAFTVTPTANVGFVSQEVLGQTHSVMQVEPSAGDSEGVFVNGATIARGDINWTLFGQFKSDGSTPTEESGIFTLGDPYIQGASISCIFTAGGQVKLHLGFNDDGNEMSVEYDGLGTTLLDGDWHTIAITSSSRDLDNLDLYVADMETPVAKSRINEGRGVYIEGVGLSLGHVTNTGLSISSVKGYYSNWQVYKEVLSNDSLRVLQTNGVLDRSDLSILDVRDTLTVIYDQSANLWESADAKQLRLLQVSTAITDLQNPPLGPIMRAVSNTTQTVSSDAAGDTVLFEVEKSSVNMNLVSGELEFLEGGIYTILVGLNLGLSGFTGNIETWVEIYDPSSTSWLTIDDSGKVKEFDSVNEGNVYYNSVFEVIAGTKLRLRARTSAFGITLASQTLTNGVAAPSATLSVSKV